MTVTSNRASAPPFLVAAALLFWGYEVDWLGVAALMAIGIESARWMRIKWDFSDKDLNRIWDLCMVLFLAALMIWYTSVQKREDGRYQFFQWFPMIFLPLILGQVYGSREFIPTTAFSWVARQHRKHVVGQEQTIDVRFGYFAVCLISAGAANHREGFWFFAGICFLSAWGFWAARSKRFSAPIWAASFLAIIMFAFAGQIGLTKLQGFMESSLASYLKRESAGLESATELGQMGRIKLSGQIIMRVQGDTHIDTSLLPTASFNALTSTKNSAWTWITKPTPFSKMEAEPNGSTWQLAHGRLGNEALTVFTALPSKSALLALPRGTTTIQDLPVNSMETNGFGTVRVSGTSGLIGYQAWFGSYRSPGDIPKEVDLSIPDTVSATIRSIYSGLGISEMTPAGQVSAISDFFEKNFSYSLYVPQNAETRGRPSSLGTFLTQTHAGHCEYFATATVLLLRQAGIPARYVTGYSLQEKGPNGMFIVRERHAHAWTEYWIGERWEELDTTPGIWRETERLNASQLEWVSDWWSGIIFRFQKWRWLGDENQLERLAPLILLPLAIWLLWRVVTRKRTKDLKTTLTGRVGHTKPGLDSEFYWIERHVTSFAGDRPAGQPLSVWLKNLFRDGAQAEEIQLLLQLHYRYRFDPAGVSIEERNELRDRTAKWLAHRVTNPEDQRLGVIQH